MISLALCSRYELGRVVYSQDKQFLKDRAYPIMKGASLFFLDTLTEHPETGELVSGPSNSPEIGGLVMGPTMDHNIIRHLLRSTADAAEELLVDADLVIQFRETADRIAKNRIGQHGQLQEWLEDKDDPNNKHRHVSHLSQFLKRVPTRAMLRMLALLSAHQLTTAEHRQSC